MTNLKPLKTRFKRDFATGLVAVIKKLQSHDLWVDDMDKLHISVLAELSEKLEVKLLKADQTEFQLKLTPAIALSLRILYLEYIKDSTTYMGSKLLVISNEVDRVYN